MTMTPSTTPSISKQIALIGLVALVPLLPLLPLGALGQGSLGATNSKAQEAQTSLISDTDVRLGLNIVSDNTNKQTQVLKVPQNAWVKLQVTSDTPGELHIHAYRLKLTMQSPGTQTLSFQAKASGKFNIEWHPKKKDRPDANTHSQAHAHAPPLASLQVEPPP